MWLTKMLASLRARVGMAAATAGAVMARRPLGPVLALVEPVLVPWAAEVQVRRMLSVLASTAQLNQPARQTSLLGAKSPGHRTALYCAQV